MINKRVILNLAIARFLGRFTYELLTGSCWTQKMLVRAVQQLPNDMLKHELMPDELITLGKRPRCFNGSWQGEQTKGRTDENESGSSSSPGSRDRRNLSGGKNGLVRSIGVVSVRFLFDEQVDRYLSTQMAAHCQHQQRARAMEHGRSNNNPQLNSSRYSPTGKQVVARCKATTSWTCSRSADHFFSMQMSLVSHLWRPLKSGNRNQHNWINFWI